MMFDPMKGRPKDNYEVLGAVTTKSFIVPAGKRWLVIGGTAERDVSASMQIEIYNASNKVALRGAYTAAGTTLISWGSMAVVAADRIGFPILLETGMYVKYTWGAAQTSPEVTCLVMEYDL